MGRRKSTFRLETDEVQGEGSFVVLRRVTVGEVRRAREGEYTDAQVIVDHVVAWDWVDDGDQALPVPRDQPDVVDALTMDEKDFIIDALLQRRGEERAKN